MNNLNEKKLCLKKSSIVNLDAIEMKNLKGGDWVKAKSEVGKLDKVTDPINGVNSYIVM